MDNLFINYHLINKLNLYLLLNNVLTKNYILQYIIIIYGDIQVFKKIYKKRFKLFEGGLKIQNINNREHTATRCFKRKSYI